MTPTYISPGELEPEDLESVLDERDPQTLLIIDDPFITSSSTDLLRKVFKSAISLQQYQFIFLHVIYYIILSFHRLVLYI